MTARRDVGGNLIGRSEEAGETRRIASQRLRPGSDPGSDKWFLRAASWRWTRSLDSVLKGFAGVLVELAPARLS